jgi:hypothetical protein
MLKIKGPSSERDYRSSKRRSIPDTTADLARLMLTSATVSTPTLEPAMRALSRALTPILLVALVAGCGARSAGASDPAETAFVRVTNQSWLDMNVYVLRSGERIRLGTVTGNHTERFRLPRGVVFSATPLRFLADPIGSSQTSQSFEISVSPGDEVSLTIPPATR